MSGKILVIDDNKDIRVLLSFMFKKKGYEVVEAQGAREALQKLKADALPNLIFLDNRMDEMDGPEFLLHLEQTQPEVLRKVPIIMLTADVEMIRGGVKATEIVSKSVGVEPLLALAARYLH